MVKDNKSMAGEFGVSIKELLKDEFETNEKRIDHNRVI